MILFLLLALLPASSLLAGEAAAHGRHEVSVSAARAESGALPGAEWRGANADKRLAAMRIDGNHAGHPGCDGIDDCCAPACCAAGDIVAGREASLAPNQAGVASALGDRPQSAHLGKALRPPRS